MWLLHKANLTVSDSSIVKNLSVGERSMYSQFEDQQRISEYSYPKLQKQMTTARELNNHCKGEQLAISTFTCLRRKSRQK